MLRMCIRALDYLAPVDITFGDYLRALITADLGQVEDDKFGYRTAMFECVPPARSATGNLRTVSVESLCWNRPDCDPERPDVDYRRPGWLDEVVGRLEMEWQAHHSRWEIHCRQRKRCREVHEILAAWMAGHPDRCRQLGLKPGLDQYGDDGRSLRDGSVETNFEVRNVRGARRQQPNGKISTEIIIVLAQREPVPFDVDNRFFWYTGGTTVVIDPSNERNLPEIKYTIWKRIREEEKDDEGKGKRDERLFRELDFRARPPAQDLRAMYFGDRGMAGREPFAALHSTEY